jgi:hypothetical protein
MFTKVTDIDDLELKSLFIKSIRDIIKKIMNEAQSYFEFINNLSERGIRFNTSGKILYYSNKDKKEHIELDIDNDLHLQSNFEIMIERIKKNILEMKKRRKVVEVYVIPESIQELFSEDDINNEEDSFIQQQTANNREKYRQKLTKIAEDKKSEAKHVKTHTLKQY